MVDTIIRVFLADAELKMQEVRHTAVCLLVGPDTDDPSRALACIGEGDNVNEPFPAQPFRSLARAAHSEAPAIRGR